MSIIDDSADINFDDNKISKKQIEEAIFNLGYTINGSTKKTDNSLISGLTFGLMPHIGCIGFIVASILGSTLLITYFRPILLNQYFFHILIALSFLFATIGTYLYLRKNNLVSIAGISKKRNYISIMYGTTIGINLLLLFVIFPAVANFDVGFFSTNYSNNNLSNGENSIIKLAVDIPCSGHAALISGDIKTINGVSGVRYSMPNIFEVAYVAPATKQDLLNLEIFDTYKATVLEERISDRNNYERFLIESVGLTPQLDFSQGACTINIIGD